MPASSSIDRGGGAAIAAGSLVLLIGFGSVVRCVPQPWEPDRASTTLNAEPVAPRTVVKLHAQVQGAEGAWLRHDGGRHALPIADLPLERGEYTLDVGAEGIPPGQVRLDLRGLAEAGCVFEFRGGAWRADAMAPWRCPVGATP